MNSNGRKPKVKTEWFLYAATHVHQWVIRRFTIKAIDIRITSKLKYHNQI
jgi:hypothetical protein